MLTYIGIQWRGRGREGGRYRERERDRGHEEEEEEAGVQQMVTYPNRQTYSKICSLRFLMRPFGLDPRRVPAFGIAAAEAGYKRGKLLRFRPKMFKALRPYSW